MAEPVDYAKALDDPAAHFAGPEAVLATPIFSKEQKLALLRQWEYDESELAVADEEGMTGDGTSLLRRIALALAELDPDGESPAPNKQRVPPTP